MARITDMPNEVLQIIFEHHCAARDTNKQHLNDVSHLVLSIANSANTCKTWESVVCNTKYRLPRAVGRWCMLTTPMETTYTFNWGAELLHLYNTECCPQRGKEVRQGQIWKNLRLEKENRKSLSYALC